MVNDKSELNLQRTEIYVFYFLFATGIAFAFIQIRLDNERIKNESPV